MPDKLLSFNEMRTEFEVTPRTLRYYEFLGLLQPDREERKRIYGPRERARMELIMRGRRFGFSLEAIRQWLLLYDQEDNVDQMKTFVVAANTQLQELQQQRQQLDEALAELQNLRDRVSESLG